jgi:hypothetical protein
MVVSSESVRSIRMVDRVKVVRIAPEHLRARTWIAYRLDTPAWIDEIRGFLENHDDAELKIQVVEMEEDEFEKLPEHEGAVG